MTVNFLLLLLLLLLIPLLLLLLLLIIIIILLLLLKLLLLRRCTPGRSRGCTATILPLPFRRYIIQHKMIRKAPPYGEPW